ncbi:MAG TPA: tetratricopeptide repeat protein, partial [Trichormus sp.]
VMENDIRMGIAKNYHICNYYPRQNDLCSLINQGVRFWGINAVAEAKLLFERVVSLDPNNIDGWFDLGITEERQGNFRQAVQDYRRALSLYQSPGAENLLGPEHPQFDAMLPQVYKPFPPMLSSVVTSGEDKQYELGTQLLQAIAEVSKKAEHQKVGVGEVTDPSKSNKVVGAGKFFVKLGEGAIGTYLYGTPHRQLPGGEVDTCDRCQIVRTRMMNPG